MEWSNTELDRYSRHLLLEKLGWEGVERIRRGRVLLMGDVEPTALCYLAAAGVARIALARASGRLVAAAGRMDGEGEIELLTTPITAERVNSHDVLVVGGHPRDEIAAAWHAPHRPVVVAATTAAAVAVTTLLGGNGCPACVELGSDRPPAGPLAAPLHGIAGALVAGEVLKLLAGVAPTLDSELLVAEASGRIERRPLTRRTPCPICG